MDTPLGYLVQSVGLWVGLVLAALVVLVSVGGIVSGVWRGLRLLLGRFSRGF